MLDTTLTMMTTFPFTSSQDLLNFLYYHSLIGNWEVQLCKFSISNGMAMELTTKRTNYQNQTTYATFNNIKSLITNFMDSNENLSINIALKLRYPDIQRRIMDPDDAYSDFWLNCYSNPESNTIYAAISYLERTKELPVQPITSWATYIKSLYNEYQFAQQ